MSDLVAGETCEDSNKCSRICIVEPSKVIFAHEELPLQNPLVRLHAHCPS